MAKTVIYITKIYIKLSNYVIDYQLKIKNKNLNEEDNIINVNNQLQSGGMLTCERIIENVLEEEPIIKQDIKIPVDKPKKKSFLEVAKNI